MQQIVFQTPVKRKFALVLAALAVAALFGLLVHAVLVVANVAEPAPTIVYGATDKRIWATVALALSLASVGIGGVALARQKGRFGTGSGRRGSIVALLMGIIAVVNGWLILVTADGGPNSGNGVVAGAMSVVLGLAGLVIDGVALARSRRAS